MDQNVPRYVQRALDTLYNRHAKALAEVAAYDRHAKALAEVAAPDPVSPVQNPWFAVTTQAGQELSVRRQFAVQGIVNLLPLWRPRRTWRDGLKRRLQPLFDGLIFVSCAPDVLPWVRHTQGVRRIIGDHDLPLPMDSEAMAALQAMVAHRLSYRPHLPQYAGWQARVTQGVLAGAKGRFCIESRPAHLVVNLDLIQRAVAVDVPPETVEILWTVPEGRNVALPPPRYEIC